MAVAAARVAALATANGSAEVSTAPEACTLVCVFVTAVALATDYAMAAVMTAATAVGTADIFAVAEATGALVDASISEIASSPAAVVAGLAVV